MNTNSNIDGQVFRFVTDRGQLPTAHILSIEALTTERLVAGFIAPKELHNRIKQTLGALTRVYEES